MAECLSKRFVVALSERVRTDALAEFTLSEANGLARWIGASVALFLLSTRFVVNPCDLLYLSIDGNNDTLLPIKTKDEIFEPGIQI